MKCVDVLCLGADGVSIKNKELKNCGHGLELRCPGAEVTGFLGPMYFFDGYVFTLAHFTNTRGNVNPYAPTLLNVECSCEYKTCNNDFKGEIWVTKHDNTLRQNHEFDFSKKISDEEFEKYDTHVSITERDKNFVLRQIELKKWENKIKSGWRFINDWLFIIGGGILFVWCLHFS